MERIVSFFYPDWQGALLIVLLVLACVAWAFAQYSHIDDWEDFQ
jgi:hypothetical protein